MSSYSCCSKSNKESGRISSLSGFLKIVSEESRLKLLCILRHGERCVCELIKDVGLSQSLTSHHLKDLKDVGMVSDEKRGLRVYYNLTTKGLKIVDLLFQIQKKEVVNK